MSIPVYRDRNCQCQNRKYIPVWYCWYIWFGEFEFKTTQWYTRV